MSTRQAEPAIPRGERKGRRFLGRGAPAGPSVGHLHGLHVPISIPSGGAGPSVGHLHGLHTPISIPSGGDCSMQRKIALPSEQCKIMTFRDPGKSLHEVDQLKNEREKAQLAPSLHFDAAERSVGHAKTVPEMESGARATAQRAKPDAVRSQKNLEDAAERRRAKNRERKARSRARQSQEKRDQERERSRLAMAKKRLRSTPEERRAAREGKRECTRKRRAGTTAGKEGSRRKNAYNRGRCARKKMEVAKRKEDDAAYALLGLAGARTAQTGKILVQQND